MEWVETTGRTVEEAKEVALDQLGIDESDIEFEVIEEPKMGLFGRLRAEARVRARVRPNQPRPKEDRRDRRRGKSTAGGGANASPVEAAPPAAALSTPPPAQRAKSGGREESNRGRGPRPARSAAATGADLKPEGVPMDQDVPLREQAVIGREFLVGLLATFEADGEVDIREIDDDTMELVVEGGDDLRCLIGPSGSTLTAVQEVTRRAVQRRTGARNGRLLVDVSGYRSKRKAALEQFVKGLAQGVVDSGVAKALEPMPAADRKVIHDTVNGLDGVSTTSEGEEPRRRVVIRPS